MERAVLVAVVLGPPVLLLARWTTRLDVFAAAFAALQIGLLLLCWVLQWQRRAYQRISAAELSVAGFLMTLLGCSAMSLPIYPELREIVMFGPLAMFALWCAPISLMPTFVATPLALSRVLTALDWLGVLCVATVLLPALGVDFGEVIVAEDAGLRRVFGPFGDSIALVMSFFLLSAVARRSLLRVLAYAVGLLVTASLGAIVSTVVGLFAIAWHRTRTGGGFQSGTVWRGLVAIALLVPVGLAAGSGLIARLLSPEALAFTVGQRVGSYLSAWRVFVDHPLFGVGYGGLQAVSDRYRPEDLFSAFSVNATSTAANQYLQTATDGGLLGLTALLAMLATSLSALRLAARNDAAGWFVGMWAWAVGLLVGYQTGSWLLPHLLIPFLFFIAVGCALCQERLRS